MMSGSFDVPAPTLTYVKWNPADSFAGFTFTLGNSVAELTAPNTFWDSTRGTIAFSSGKHQVFFKVLAQDGTNGVLIGLGNSSAPLGVGTHGYAGVDSNSWGYRALDGQKFHAGNNTGAGLTGVIGDVFSLMYDVGAGTISVNKNGGAPTLLFSSVTGSLFPMGSVYDAGGKIQIGSSVDFGVALASGYSDWAV